MTKLSVNETKWSSLLAWTGAYSFYFDLNNYLISGPKSYQGFREPAPEVRSRKSRSNYQARNDVLFAFKTDVLICLNVKQEDYQFAKQNALVRR